MTIGEKTRHGVDIGDFGNLSQSISRWANQSIKDFNIASIVSDILYISTTTKIIQKRWNRMSYFPTTDIVIIYMNMTLDTSFNEMVPVFYYLYEREFHKPQPHIMSDIDV